MYKGSIFNGIESFTEFNYIFDFARQYVDDALVIMLYQKNQEKDYDFNFHFDADMPHGYRICFGLDIEKPFLEFSKIKDDYAVHARELKQITLDMMEDRIYTLTPMRSNTVMQINGIDHPHRVPLTNSTNRLVFIVNGKINSQQKISYLQTISS
jgi:hypothetical protein